MRNKKKKVNTVNKIKNKINRIESWDSNLSNKCKYCRSKLYIKIFKNKANMRQMGLYCSRCQKWHRFINDDDVYYYVGVGCKIVNTYGNLYDTKLYQLRNITNIK